MYMFISPGDTSEASVMQLVILIIIVITAIYIYIYILHNTIIQCNENTTTYLRLNESDAIDTLLGRR